MSVRHWSSVELKLNRKFSSATCLLLRISSAILFSTNDLLQQLPKTKFRASVSYIYQRACLFTAILSKKSEKLRDRGNNLLHACFCFMQCTHSHNIVSPMLHSHSRSSLEVNNFWSRVKKLSEENSHKHVFPMFPSCACSSTQWEKTAASKASLDNIKELLPPNKLCLCSLCS